VIINRTASVHKTWKGPIVHAAVLHPGNLTIMIDEIEDSYEISMKLGEIEIPFSVEKYYNDPDGFYGDLGIVRPAEGYSADIVNFTRDGDLVVASGYLKVEDLLSGADRHVDLPDGWVLGTMLAPARTASAAITGTASAAITRTASAAVTSTSSVGRTRSQAQVQSRVNVSVSVVPDHADSRTGTIIGVTISSVLTVGCIIAGYCICKRSRREASSHSMVQLYTSDGQFD
jgi:hypothetical protein